MKKTDALKKYFLPYQAEVIKDPARYILYEKSARIGITHAVAYKVVEDCCKKKRWHKTWWYQANDKATAKEFINDIELFAKLFNYAYSFIGERVIDEENDIKAFIAEFEDGHRVIALSSNPKALYGKGGNVILDEYALHPQAGDLYKAAQRCIMWGGCFLIFSQHQSEKTEFNRLCKEARAVAAGKLRAGKDTLPWSHHLTSIRDAVAAGLFDKLKALGATEAETAEQFLELLRAGCKDEEHFNMIYLCIPATEADAYIAYGLIDGCVDPQIEANPPWARLLIDKAEELYPIFRNSGIDPDPRNAQLLEILDKFKPELQGELYLGRDIGRKRDLTVDWIAAREGRKLRTRAVIELDKKPFFVQKKILFALLALENMTRASIDSTGLGAQMAEEAIDLFGTKAEAIDFTGPVKEALAGLVLRTFQDNEIVIPSASQLRESVHSVKRYPTPTGHFRFDADRTDATGHADHFWALGLMLNAQSGPAVTVDFVSSREKLASSRITM
jgi:phage FluMu gp28-like protein